eukprot:8161693-Pyramimonas_sp.AAC.1
MTGRGGLQGARPRAGQLEGPASRGLDERSRLRVSFAHTPPRAGAGAAPPAVACACQATPRGSGCSAGTAGPEARTSDASSPSALQALKGPAARRTSGASGCLYPGSSTVFRRRPLFVIPSNNNRDNAHRPVRSTQSVRNDTALGSNAPPPSRARIERAFTIGHYLRGRGSNARSLLVTTFEGADRAR